MSARTRLLEDQLATAEQRADRAEQARDTLQARLDEGLAGFKEQTIVVHQPGGSPSLRGVLLEVYRDCIVLGRATMLDPEGEIGGESVIPRAPGMWWQANAPEPR